MPINGGAGFAVIGLGQVLSVLPPSELADRNYDRSVLGVGAVVAGVLLLALAWQVATVPAFVGITSGGAERSVLDGVAFALITGIAGWLGAVRWVTAKKVDFNSPMVATE